MKQQRVAVYPGSFDPITYGHLDIIKRSLSFMDFVIVALGKNNFKSYTFSEEERKSMLEHFLSESLTSEELGRISIKSFDGMLVDFIKKEQASVIIRGIRIFSDFDYEFNLAGVNSKLCPEIPTIFLTPSENKQFISSKFAKNIAWHNGNTELFVTEEISKAIKVKRDLKKK